MSGSDQKRARGRPRKMSGDAVLDVAMNAYWQNDPADVSVNAICQLADVSKPSLYRTFGSEDGLTLASLDRYAEQILSDILAVLKSGEHMQATLDALIEFACNDPRMESGCLFYKMRAGKHRLGPKTRARIDEINESAIEGFEAFLQTCRDTGEWSGSVAPREGAEYLSEQIALAFAQRASGLEPSRIRTMLRLSLSVFVNGMKEVRR